jgi:hypothetical protein
MEGRSIKDAIECRWHAGDVATARDLDCVRSGIAAARARGKRPGRPRLIVGGDRTKEDG